MNSVTIVVCAYAVDRSATLRRAVDIVLKQISYPDELLVIVDYNDSLLAHYRQHITGCRIIPNRNRRGLSGARNTALELARGEIVAFIDDDAVPLDGWLQELRAPYADNSIYGVGGFAKPHWCRGKPRWFPDEFLWVVGCSHTGLPSNAWPVRNLVGVNMSFRRSAFDEVGGFAETMGRVRDRPLGCEETEFCIRLTRANPNAILLYNPSAAVEHYVPGERGSVRYFARRCWAEGLSKAEVAQRLGRSSALSVERHYVTRVLPQGLWYGMRDAGTGDIWGAGRAIAIICGLVITTAGYCIGRLRSAKLGPRLRV